MLAASVHITLPEGEQIQDEFYHESTELFSIITRHFESRLGVTTKTVENEAKKTLMKVVTGTLQQGAADQLQSFEVTSHHWNKCMDRMERYLLYLSIEPAPMELVTPIEADVSRMYKEIVVRRKPFPRLREEAEKEVEKEKIRFGGNQDAIKRQTEIIYEHKIRQHYQLHRLHGRPASKADRRILAEAILIQRYYAAKERGFQLFLASCDSNNFCPYYSKEYGLSTPVTDEIQMRFKIYCERPKELAKMLREELEPPREEEYQAEEDEADGEDDETEVEEANKKDNDSDKPSYVS